MTAVDRRKHTLFSIAALVSAILDQLTKVWAADRLPPLGSRGLSVYGRHVVLVYARNPGVAFSGLQGLANGRILLSLLSLAALALVVMYLRKLPSALRAHALGLGLIFGGALGNLIDRLRLGKVTDFVLVDTGFWPFNPWPVFNVADAALVIGIVLLALATRFARAGAPATPR
jgi:signal peptidase II